MVDAGARNSDWLSSSVVGVDALGAPSRQTEFVLGSDEVRSTEALYCSGRVASFAVSLMLRWNNITRAIRRTTTVAIKPCIR